MKKQVIIFSLIIVGAFGGDKGVVLAADLCGGTGGNGQIIEVGDNAFTMKRNGDERNQIIHLTDKATIKASNGTISLSDLKIGDRTTLVGGPNRDGSFTAEAVFVCAAASETVKESEIQPVQKPAVNSNKVNAWSRYINMLTLLLVGAIWIEALMYFRFWKKKSWVYLLFFTIFYIYMIKVFDYTLFRFQSLIILKHFTPGLMLNGQTAEKSLNLIPLLTLKLEDVRTSLLNILLMIPFGFGMPFITNLRFKKIVITGALFSISIELLQLVTGLIAKMTFRVTDINDVIFNTVGAAIGYTLFRGLVNTFKGRG